MTHLAHYAQIKSLIRQRLNPVAAQILGELNYVAYVQHSSQ